MSWSSQTCKTKRTAANSSTCRTRSVVTKVRQDQKFCNSLNVVVLPNLLGCHWLCHSLLLCIVLYVSLWVSSACRCRSHSQIKLSLHWLSKPKTWSLVLCLESLPNSHIHNEASCFVSATIYFLRDIFNIILMTLRDSASMIETESNITAQLLQMAASKSLETISQAGMILKWQQPKFATQKSHTWTALFENPCW